MIFLIFLISNQTFGAGRTRARFLLIGILEFLIFHNVLFDILDSQSNFRGREDLRPGAPPPTAPSPTAPTPHHQHHHKQHQQAEPIRCSLGSPDESTRGKGQGPGRRRPCCTHDGPKNREVKSASGARSQPPAAVTMNPRADIAASRSWLGRRPSTAAAEPSSRKQKPRPRPSAPRGTLTSGPL